MNKIDTLTWTDDFSQRLRPFEYRRFEYRGKTLRIWLFGWFFQIGIGRQV